MMNYRSHLVLFQYDARTNVEQSTFKCSNKSNCSELTMHQTNKIPVSASVSKRSRTMLTRCKRNFSDLIKYNQRKEKEEELAVSPRKKIRVALKNKKNKINKPKHFNFTTIHQTNPEGNCVSISQRDESAPSRCKRNLSNLYKYNQSKNKTPDEKCVKLATYYLKKLSLTQSQEECDSEMDWCYDSSMDWRYDSEMDSWSYDSEMDWSYDSEMDWCYDSSMDWSYDLEYSQ